MESLEVDSILENAWLPSSYTNHQFPYLFITKAKQVKLDQSSSNWDKTSFFIFAGIVYMTGQYLK